jgi:alpha-L-fucosidase 2
LDAKNINFQMHYWPVFAANLKECAEPLIGFFDDLAVSGAVTADDYYGVREGWVAHGFTDLWKGTGMKGGAEWAFCPVCGAWAALILFEQVQFMEVRDSDLVERVFAVLAGASKFLLGYLHDQDGVLMTSPGSSPENSFSYNGSRAAYIAKGTSFDTAVIVDVWSATITVAGMLGGRAQRTLARKLGAALEKLPNRGVPESKDGLLLEYPRQEEPLDPGHRHWSGLYSIYPGAARVSTSNLTTLASKSITKKLDAGGGHTGWSRAWAVNLLARVGDGDRALESLQIGIQRFLSYNLLGLHPQLSPNGICSSTCYTPAACSSAGNVQAMTTAQVITYPGEYSNRPYLRVHTTGGRVPA